MFRVYTIAAVESRNQSSPTAEWLSSCNTGITAPKYASRPSHADDQIEKVIFSFLKHLATYATGRTLSYNELEFLREQAVELKKSDYRVLDAFRVVINSPVFLEK